jgi:hypothetical protein
MCSAEIKASLNHSPEGWNQLGDKTLMLGMAAYSLHFLEEQQTNPYGSGSQTFLIPFF